MAYGLKYKITFTDMHRVNPAAWEIDFYFPDYTGDTIDLQPGGTPLVIVTGDDTDDKTTAIFGSEAQITVVPDDNGIIRADFYTTENFKIKCVILKDNVAFWRGFCKADFCEYELAINPYEFTISASDCIALLKNINIDLVDLSRSGTGYVSMLQILTELGLYKALNDEIQLLRVISSLHRTGQTETFSLVSARWELWFGDDGFFMPIYDVLEQIAASFQGRIFFSGISYWFQRIADLSNTDITQASQYTTPDIGPSPVDIDLFKILNGDMSTGDLVYVEDSSYVTIGKAVKSFTNDINYKYRNLLVNFDWSAYASGQFTGWDASDWSLISQGGTGTLEDPYYCLFNGDTGGTEVLSQWMEFDFYNKARISCKIDMSNCKNSAWQLHAFYDTQDITEDHKVFLENGWVDFNLGIGGVGTSAWHNFISSPTTDDGILDFSVEINNPPPVVGAGRTFVGWYNNIMLLFVDPDGDGTPQIKIYDVKVEFIPHGYTGEIDKAVNDKAFSDNKEVSNITLTDGNLQIANSLYYAGDDQDANTWTADDHDYNTRPFQTIALSSIMGQNSFPPETMKGTYYGNNVQFYNVIKRDLDDKLFMQMYNSYDVKKCVHSMTMVEIKPVVNSVNDYNITKKYKPLGISGSPIRIG